MPSLVDILWVSVFQSHGGGDQRGDDGPVFGAAIRSSEECVLGVQRDRANRTFDDVGVDLNATGN